MNLSTSESLKPDKTDRVSVFIFLWMTIAIPLYVENRYFNILQAKGHAFDAGCILGLLLIVFASLRNREIVKLKPSWSLIDAGLIVMAFAAVVSSILSESFKDAFLGEKGWCIGGFAFLMAALMYLYLAKSFSFKQNCWMPVIAINGFIFITGILHSAGKDALGLHENIYPDQFYQYISTIGNVNWYVGYLCLLIPMMACFFIEAEKLISQTIYLMVLALGEINMVLTGSDGLYLGIGVCAFFAVPYMLRDKRAAGRFFVLVLIYGLALVVVSVCPIFAEKKAMIDGFSTLFLRPMGYLTVVAIGIAGVVVFRVMKEGNAKKLCGFMTIALEAGLGVITLFFAVKTVENFGPDWGSGRGAIWLSSIDIFRGLDPIQKTFGVGPEMLGPYFAEYSIGLSRRVLAAHSEQFQILLSMGIAGLVGWIILWTGVIRRCFRDRLWRTPVMAFFLPLMAYLGQSLVNTPMATNFGILIMVISLFVYNSDRTWN